MRTILGIMLAINISSIVGMTPQEASDKQFFDTLIKQINCNMAAIKIYKRLCLSGIILTTCVTSLTALEYYQPEDDQNTLKSYAQAGFFALSTGTLIYSGKQLLNLIRN